MNFGYSLYRLKKSSFLFESIVGALVAAALILAASYSRRFALRVQDRVIRLEMQLRLERNLPADLKSRIGGLTLAQLVAMRFASDNELAELSRLVLPQKLSDSTAIKQSIKNWQADILRA